MSHPLRPATFFAGLVIVTTGFAQGPGSCGFHLDLITNDTSTHSAIADIPGAPGAHGGIGAGMAPGALGNPYSAYASPGTLVKARMHLPAGMLANFAATTPYGPGSTVSLLYAVGASNVSIPPPPGTIPGCSLPTWIISILPLGGALVDGLGITTPAPLYPPADPGFPGAFEVTFPYPPLGAPPVNFQAVFRLPTLQIAVSNGVSLLTGPSPHQASIPLAPPTGCPWAPSDEGLGVVAMPPGFEFYSVPTASGVARPNGLVEFGPAAGTLCPSDQFSDFACAPGELQVSPRVNVNLVDNDLAVTPAPGIISGLTVEYAPPTPTAPSRTIVRWKHVSPWYTIPANTILTADASSVVEFWGNDFPGGSIASPRTIVVVRQDFHGGINGTDVHGGLGVGPGEFGQGFGGPPLICNYVDIWTTWGGWFFTAGAGPEAIISNFHPAYSAILSNLATAFTPVGPGVYKVEAF